MSIMTWLGSLLTAVPKRAAKAMHTREDELCKGQRAMFRESTKRNKQAYDELHAELGRLSEAIGSKSRQGGK